MRACDIKIGEVRAVRFMEIVITFPQRGVGGRYYGKEDGRGCDLGRDLGKGEETVF